MARLDHVNMVVRCPRRGSPFRVYVIKWWWSSRKCDCCAKLWWILTDGERYKIRAKRPAHMDATPPPDEVCQLTPFDAAVVS